MNIQLPLLVLRSARPGEGERGGHPNHRHHLFHASVVFPPTVCWEIKINKRKTNKQTNKQENWDKKEKKKRKKKGERKKEGRKEDREIEGYLHVSELPPPLQGKKKQEWLTNQMYLKGLFVILEPTISVSFISLPRKT